MRSVFLSPNEFNIRTQNASAEITNRSVLHHLHNVIRLKKSEELIIFNGEGDYRKASVESLEKKSLILKLSSLESYQPKHSISLGLAWLKKDALESSLGVAVQLGVEKINLFASEYSGPAIDINKPRIEKIINSAMEQSNHYKRPEVILHKSLESCVDSTREEKILCFDLAESNNEIGDLDGKLLYLIGPEGGFSRNEINMLAERNVKFFQLDTAIMRAPVAASCAMGYILAQT